VLITRLFCSTATRDARAATAAKAVLRTAQSAALQPESVTALHLAGAAVMRTNQAVTCPAQECAGLESYGGGRRGKRPLPRGPAPGLTRSRFHPAQPFPLPLGAAPHRPINHPVIEGDLLAQHPRACCRSGAAPAPRGFWSGLGRVPAGR